MIVLNVHDPTGDKIDDMKVSFSYKLECAFYKFPEYCLSFRGVTIDGNGFIDTLMHTTWNYK
jgi:hypothetical protein